MQDKLGPISDLVAELKKKKPMTQSEEIHTGDQQEASLDDDGEENKI